MKRRLQLLFLSGSISLLFSLIGFAEEEISPILQQALEQKAAELGFERSKHEIPNGDISDSAQVSDFQYDTKVRVSMISEYKSVTPGKAFWVALILQMPKGWHIYWQNPGDESGMATTVNWDVPDGFTIEPADWPTPERIDDLGSVSYGYVGGETPILAKIMPSKFMPIGHSFPIKAHISWIECEEYCSPGEANLETKIDIVEKDPEWNIPGRYIIEKAQSERPMPLAHGWTVKAERYPDKIIKLKISAPVSALNPDIEHVYFYPFDLSIPTNGPQTLTKEGNTLVLEMWENESMAPVKLEGLIYTPDRWMQGSSVTSMVIDTVITKGSNKSESLEETPIIAQSKDPLGLITFMGLGLLGGLILNLMPCVFPILGVKVLEVVNQTKRDAHQIRMHGFVFTLGVLASFWALAFILHLLKEGGMQLGWGFQLQSPIFVFCLLVLMLVFGLSLSGLFEVGESLIRLTDKLDGKKGYTGSFLSGVLDTVVATPCSAPFLAPALGAALILPLVPSLAVFTAIGFGLALPYLALCMFPKAINLLPKPGAWMETFKQLMAFFFYATAAYLLWVIIGQVDPHMLLNILLGLIIIALSTWVYGRFARAQISKKMHLMGALVAWMIFLGGFLIGLPTVRTEVVEWETWSVDRVKELREEGRPILVEFTARWCVTCQKNNKAYDDPEVVQMIHDKNVATLMADWTNRDAHITAALNGFGRSAVPLALFYPPDGGEPEILPSVILSGTVLDILHPLPSVMKNKKANPLSYNGPETEAL